MQLKFLLVLVMAAVASSQSQVAQMCISTTTTTASAPACVLTFTPWMAPQIGPFSTVYETIMTTVFNVVDCRYCSVTNVDANPIPRGPFTAKITVPILTQTRVGCMPETTAITRRDYRGYSQPSVLRPRSDEFLYLDPENAFIKRQKRGLPYILHRSIEEVRTSNLKGRSLQSAADELAQEIDPNNDLLPFKAYTWLVELNSALFAINLVNSGFNLNRTCQEARDPTIQLQLTAASLNPKQVGDIVCFASVFGFSLNTTNFELLNKLQAAIYAIQVGSNFSSNRTDLCQYLDLPFGPYLGIENNEITDYVCGTGGVVSSNTSSSTTATSTNSTTMHLTTSVAGTAITGTAVTGTGASAGTMSTGEHGSYTNTTTPASTNGWSDVSTTSASNDEPSVITNNVPTMSSGTGPHTSVNTYPSASGKSNTTATQFGYSTASWGTAAPSSGYGTAPANASDSWSINFPNATYSFNATHLPPAPTRPVYVPYWITATSSSEARKKY